MLAGFLPDQLSIEGIADWLMLAVGLTVGTSIASVIFQPLENAVSKGA